MTTISSPHRLDELLLDVLTRIIASIESTKDLVRLSETCRALRTLCAPLIFSHARRYIHAPVDSKRRFIKAFLWPYLRHLTLEDICADRADTAMQTIYNQPLYTQDPALCGVLDSPKLFSLLRHMPRLTKISLVLEPHAWIHGLSRFALRSFLTLPQLREFSVANLLLSPTESALSEGDTISFPLTLFHHERTVSRRYPPTSAEKENINILLSKLYGSLKSLVMPAELAPIAALSQWDWSHLRELRIRGAQWKAPCAPYNTLFSRMRELHVLVLELSLPADAEPRPTLDPDRTEEFPWPALEHFSVSHPLVHDPTYALLPQRLQVLSLTCCPHVAERPFLTGGRRMYSYPLRTSSELLEILQHCRARDLLELHLEYHADESESTLLSFVSSELPKIQTLQIYRYRISNAGDIAVDEFAQLLSPLAHLRVLQVHLDLEYTPLPDFSMRVLQRGFEQEWVYDDNEMDQFRRNQHVIAETLARTLSASVREIHVWRPAHSGRHLWSRFRVDRCTGDTDKDSRSDVRVSRDDDVIYADFADV